MTALAVTEMQWCEGGVALRSGGRQRRRAHGRLALAHAIADAIIAECGPGDA